MKLTADGSELYMAAAMNDPSATAVSVQRFTVNRSGGTATGITPNGSTTISGMRHVLSLAEVPGQTRRIWAFGFTGPVFTSLPYIPDTTPPLSTYATAMGADFTPGRNHHDGRTDRGPCQQRTGLALVRHLAPRIGSADHPRRHRLQRNGRLLRHRPVPDGPLRPGRLATAHPICDISSADCNASGAVDFFDIDPFLAILFAP